MAMRSDPTQGEGGLIDKQLLVSVIIVVKNGAHYLASALQSIFQQDYSPIEVLVVDGQSTDDTARIAQSFGNVQYIWQANLGVANARNIGIQAAQGDVIAFLDYDDLWPRDKLSVQVDYLENHLDIMFTITHVRLFLEQGHLLRPGFKRESFQTGQIGCIASTLVARRVVFKHVGGFNPDLVIGGDVDWFARARDAGIPMDVIPQVLLFKRIHNDNISANVQTNTQELLAVIRKSVDRKRTTNGFLNQG